MPAIYSLVIWRRAAALCRIHPATIRAQYLNLRGWGEWVPCGAPTAPQTHPQTTTFLFVPQLNLSSFLPTPAMWNAERNLPIFEPSRSFVRPPHLVQQEQERQCLQSPHLRRLVDFYWEWAALKSSVEGLEGGKRTRRWSIAVICCGGRGGREKNEENIHKNNT